MILDTQEIFKYSENNIKTDTQLPQKAPIWTPSFKILPESVELWTPSPNSWLHLWCHANF
jgi:hypothetical protein